MTKRKPRQVRLWDHDPDLQVLPSHIVVISTEGEDLQKDADVEQIVREMMAVAMAKHILLDFVKGIPPRDPRRQNFTPVQNDPLRQQTLLNSECHGRRFNWLGDDEIAKMVRQSIATESWKPKRKEAARRSQ